VPDHIGDFLALSTRLTGFSTRELLATGMVDDYLAVSVRELGAHRYRQLLDQKDLVAAKAVTRLWYTGSWALDGTSFVVSARSYAAALVWRTIGVPAPGTAPAGYGSWATAP
jgi:hypothetical protein